MNRKITTILTVIFLGITVLLYCASILLYMFDSNAKQLDILTKFIKNENEYFYIEDNTILRAESISEMLRDERSIRFDVTSGYPTEHRTIETIDDAMEQLDKFIPSNIQEASEYLHTYIYTTAIDNVRTMLNPNAESYASIDRELLLELRLHEPYLMDGNPYSGAVKLAGWLTLALPVSFGIALFINMYTLLSYMFARREYKL